MNDKLKDILAEREEAYGDPREMHELIAEYWSTYLEDDIDAKDVAIMMTLFKIARSSHGDNEKTADDLLDGLGYLSFAEEFSRPAKPRGWDLSKISTDEPFTFEFKMEKSVPEEVLDLYYGDKKQQGEKTAEEKTVETFKTPEVKAEDLKVEEPEDRGNDVGVAQYLWNEKEAGDPASSLDFQILDDMDSDNVVGFKIKKINTMQDDFDKLCGKKPVKDYQAFIDDLFERGTS